MIDIEKAIKKCEKNREHDETICFAIGVGRMVPELGNKKEARACKEAIEFIKTLDGFLGVTPLEISKNLLLFDTLNNAKGAKNMMTFKGIIAGNIIPVLIKTKYLEK